MPELPEVETVCRGLRPHLEGKHLKQVIMHRPDLRFPLPEHFAQRLTSRRVTRITRRAKYILTHLDDGWVWLTHLGMSGKFRLNPSHSAAHDHIVIHTDGDTTLTYHDPRRFGFMDLVAAAHLDDAPALRLLGIEPLSEALTPDYLHNRLSRSAAPLKALLLDQRQIAGIGNIYACESLYRAGLHPARVGHSLTKAEAARLVTALQSVLTEAIAAGGSSLRDYRDPDGELGCFQHRFAVYQREGEPCLKDGSPIQRRTQSGRSTFFCATCQH